MPRLRCHLPSSDSSGRTSKGGQTDRLTPLLAEGNGELGQGALRCWGRVKEQPGLVKSLSLPPPQPLSVQEWSFCRGSGPGKVPLGMGLAGRLLWS